ncbi:hypothetical protein [Microbacterium sp.]|uniref:hypothetical protein n=1 Tax=Microbacterium sp. TaxID=51671 RepID=UPI00261D2684|nr:hypothetical protein [Microbacterium sp.]
MKTRLAAACGIVLLALTGCAAIEPAAPPEPSTAAGHGAIPGAQELAEPALHLAAVDAAGIVHHLDLLDEHESVLAEIEPIDELVSDGRYLFGIRDGSVTVIDSGVWTRSHGDHFHYYEAPARVLGEIDGQGRAAVVAGASGIGIRFDDEAVLVEAAALGEGEIVESFRIDIAPHTGFVVPLAEGAAVTEPDDTGAVRSLRMVDADGAPQDSVPCEAAAGTIATVVGTVVGCSDAALLAVDGDPAAWERIAYPTDAVAPATSFAAREGRPTVAAVAGDSGIWLLDTRERSWSHVELGEQVIRVGAVDDDAGRVLALTATGAVLVIAEGEVIARTEPLVAASLADPETAAGVAFVIDQHRAYLNGPAEKAMWEIDPADDARISRTFPAETEPVHFAGTGR